MPKSLKLTEPFIHSPKEKNVKHYLACADTAAQQACLDIGDGVTMIEKYCDECTKVTESKGR